MSSHHASIHYAPGPAFALVRPGLVILVDASVGTAVAAELWAAIEAADASVAPAVQPSGWTLAPLLDTVTEVLDPTWRALPSFAIAVLDAGRRAGQVSVQVAVRGAFSAAVTTRTSAQTTPDGPQHGTTELVLGPDVTTWVDTMLDDVLEVELLSGAGSDAAPVLAIVDGIVQVAQVRWDVRDAAVADSGLAAEAAQSLIPDVHTDGSDARASDVDVIAAGSADSADSAVGVVAVRSLVGAASAHASSPALQAEADFGRTLATFPEEWEEEAAEHRATSGPVESDSESDDADGFDDTTFFASDLVQIKTSTSDGEPFAPGGAPALPAEAILPPPPPLPAPAVVQAPAVALQTQLQAPAPVESFRDPAPRGTEILARSCFFGHANPPARMTCAQCGGGLSPTAQLVERPSLGRVEVSTGESIDLSVPIVVGRFPQAQTTSSPIAQRLVTVPSPSQDISRSHLEVRLDGWHVLLVDLDTVNGTTLLRAGQHPRRLHPLEPTLVADGDVVDLGDGVTLTFRELV